MEKTKYSVLIGIVKTAKNSAILLVPFVLAILAGIPLEYAWITGPIAYFLKNLYETKTRK
jgi:hypothetical protein